MTPRRLVKWAFFLAVALVVAVFLRDRRVQKARSDRPPVPSRLVGPPYAVRAEGEPEGWPPTTRLAPETEALFTNVFSTHSYQRQDGREDSLTPAQRRRENLAFWDKLRKLRYPDIRKLERVEFEYLPAGCCFHVAERAWLVAESPEEVWLLHNDLVLRRWIPGSVVYRDVGFQPRHEEKGWRAAWEWIRARLGYPPGPQPGEMINFPGGCFGLALFASQLGQTDQAREFLQTGVQREPLLCQRAYRWLAADVYRKALERLEEGASRPEVASLLRRAIRVFPDTSAAQPCRDLAPVLERMAKEVRTPPAPAASPDQQARYWVWKLRDQKGKVAAFGSCYFTFEPHLDNPAGMLFQIGKPALPALIAALDDLEATRAVHYDDFDSEKSYVYRVCDAAILIIEHLSVYTFNLSGRPLSQASAEERRKVIRHVQGWWARHQHQTRREWLLPRIEAGDTVALRGLVEAEGSQAVPLLRQLLQHQVPDLRVEAAALLREVQGEEGQAALLALLRDPDPDARDGAVWHVVEQGKEQAWPHLRPLLQDPDPTVRARVAQALEGLPAAVPDLIPLLDDHARTNLPERDTSTGRRFRLKVCHVVSRVIAHTTDQDLDEGMGIREDLLDQRMDRLKAWWEREKRKW